MHVVVDLGENYSYLVCWEKGQFLDDACIKVKLPGIASFRSPGEDSSWEYDQLNRYLSYIQREYLLPSRRIIESAALAIPDIFDLRHRRILLDIMEEILGLYEASIIPRSLALLAGMQMRNPQSELSGDVLLIDESGPGCRCALVSIIDKIGLTLETQVDGSVAELLQQAAGTGYYAAGTWHIDQVVLSCPAVNNPAITKLITALPPHVNIIHGNDLEFAAAEGLSGRAHYKDAGPAFRYNVIYPYQFYLERNNSPHLEKLPFDTANLELDCDGRYTITSLQRKEMESPADHENLIHFGIYEVGAGEDPPVHTNLPVLEIDISPDDLPPQIHLVLDMAAASLRLDLNTGATIRPVNAPEFLEVQLRASQEQLYQVLEQYNQDRALLNDWDNYRLLLPAGSLTLSQQIDHTLFRLYGLLQLWKDR